MAEEVNVGLLPVLWALLVGCDVEEEDYPQVLADAMCDQMYRCARADYESSYATDDECEADYLEFIEFIEDAQGVFGREYDVEAGTACVKAVRQSTCDEWDDEAYLDDCETVYQ